eukprot:766514-Hanusia_phi.AAC.5
MPGALFRHARRHHVLRPDRLDLEGVLVPVDLRIHGAEEGIQILHHLLCLETGVFNVHADEEDASALVVVAELAGLEVVLGGHRLTRPPQQKLGCRTWQHMLEDRLEVLPVELAPRHREELQAVTLLPPPRHDHGHDPDAKCCRQLLHRQHTVRAAEQGDHARDHKAGQDPGRRRDLPPRVHGSACHLHLHDHNEPHEVSLHRRFVLLLTLLDSAVAVGLPQQKHEEGAVLVCQAEETEETKQHLHEDQDHMLPFLIPWHGGDKHGYLPAAPHVVLLRDGKLYNPQHKSHGSPQEAHQAGDADARQAGAPVERAELRLEVIVHKPHVEAAALDLQIVAEEAILWACPWPVRV